MILDRYDNLASSWNKLSAGKGTPESRRREGADSRVGQEAVAKKVVLASVTERNAVAYRVTSDYIDQVIQVLLTKGSSN